MAYDLKKLRDHPGVDPRYLAAMSRPRMVFGVYVRPKPPKGVSRWLPHYGAKEAAKYARRRG